MGPLGAKTPEQFFPPKTPAPSLFKLDDTLTSCKKIRGYLIGPSLRGSNPIVNALNMVPLQNFWPVYILIGTDV